MKTVTYTVEVTLNKMPSKTERDLIEWYVLQSRNFKRIILDGVDAQVSTHIELRETNIHNYLKVNVVKTK